MSCRTKFKVCSLILNSSYFLFKGATVFMESKCIDSVEGSYLLAVVLNSAGAKEP